MSADLTTFPIATVELKDVNGKQLPNAGKYRSDVSKLASAGTGTYADPWTGWETAMQALFAANVSFCFPAGVYGYSSSFNWVNFGNMHFHGEIGTVLKYTGSGIAVSMAPTQPCQVAAFNGAFGIVFENFIIDCTGSGTVGLYLNSIHHSVFRNVFVRESTQKGFYFRFTIVNHYDTLHATTRVGQSDGTGESSPLAVGIYLDNDGNIINTVQGCQFTNPIVELCSGIGIYLGGANQNVFSAGTSENNGGKNIVCYGQGNTFQGMDLEASSEGIDFYMMGDYNVILNCLCAGTTHIGNDVDAGSSVGNQVIGGQFNELHIDTNAIYTLVQQPIFNFSSTGRYKNDSKFTTLLAAPLDYATSTPTTKTGLAASDAFTGSVFGDQWFTDSFVVEPPSASVTSAIASNAMAITLPNTTAGTLFSGKANGGHAILDTGFERIKHVSRPAAGSYQIRFAIGKSKNNQLYFMLSGTTLTYGVTSGGSGGSIASVTYNSTTMLYWRFLRAGANVKAQYSADASSWTDLGTSTGAPFDFTNFRTCLEAGSTASSTYSAAVVFDDYVIG